MAQVLPTMDCPKTVNRFTCIDCGKRCRVVNHPGATRCDKCHQLWLKKVEALAKKTAKVKQSEPKKLKPKKSKK